MSGPTTALRQLAHLARRSPAPLLAVAKAGEQVGLATLAGHAYRIASAGDVVVVTLPNGSWDLRSHRIALWRHADRDLIARALRKGFSQFEPAMPAVFLAEVRAGRGVVYDVGANTGLYSLIAAAAGVKVVDAFEPYPPVLELLHRNVALNPHAGRVNVHAVAVGSAPGHATLHVPPPAPDSPVETSASLSATFKDEIAERVEVEVTTLDAHWIAQGHPPVAVVKVDVESREADVLEGARDVLRHARPTVFYELLPGGEPERISALAQEFDYVDGYISEVEVVFGGPVEHHSSAWNHILVPRERLDAVAERIRYLELVVTRLG